MLQRKRPRERYVYVLDFMEEGNPLDRHKYHQNKPVLQILGRDYFLLMDGSPKVEDVEIRPEQLLDLEELNILKIDDVISVEDLTSIAKDVLPRILERIVEDRKSEFVSFFNLSESLTLKLHSLELLPGIGKGSLRKILDERGKRKFDSFEDIEARTGLKNVKEILVRRILLELEGGEKYNLFVYPFNSKAVFVGSLERLRI
nr:DUF655 domain-containing protein [Sulfodiicoccus acidiphilus]